MIDLDLEVLLTDGRIENCLPRHVGVELSGPTAVSDLNLSRCNICALLRLDSVAPNLKKLNLFASC